MQKSPAVLDTNMNHQKKNKRQEIKDNNKCWQGHREKDVGFSKLV